MAKSHVTYVCLGPLVVLQWLLTAVSMSACFCC
uniref:Uncharacterized protein n=1 Tax=Triticum urartu TaxID=4572 RepID=A0A8R7UV85_TRIUA